MAEPKQPLGKIAAVGAGGVALAIAAFFALRGAENPAPVPAPLASTAQPPTAVPEPTAPAAAEPELRFAIVPSADGIVTVVGTAPPGLPVSIRVDGLELARIAVLADGSFASVLDLPPSDVARVLTVAALLADGHEILSKDTGFLPPMPATAQTEMASDVPEAIVLTEQGTVVAGAAQPDMPAAQVTLDAITYGAGNLVQFSGKGQAGTFVRLYLDGVFLLESAVRAEGQWFGETDAVQPGTYVLRVDQIDTAGKVASRFETPFLRESPDALAAVAAAKPAEPTAPATQAAVAETTVAETTVAETTAPKTTAAQPVAVSAPPLVALPAMVIVQPGLTLWAIAEQEFGDGVRYVQVFEANRDKIRDPDLIYPGQVFTLPAGN